MTRMIGIHFDKLAAACVALLLTATIASCSEAANESEVSPDATTVPESALLTNRWISASPPELMTQDGTFVRAVVESWFMVQIGGSLESGYPGFPGAMAENSYEEWLLNNASNETILGTQYYKLLDIVDHSDGTAEAWYCRFGNLVGNTQQQNPGATARYAIGDGFEFPTAHSLLYQRLPPSVGDPKPPPPNQVGSNRKPSDNVFGSWAVLDIAHGSESSGPRADACRGRAPGTPEEWPAETIYSNDPPVALPPDPGWPGTPD